jgi:hypothetical protein
MRDQSTDLEREEQVTRALGRPVREQHLPPFSAVEARLRRRPSSSRPVVALLGVVLLALIVGTLLAERRTLIAQPGPVPTTASSPAPLTWQERLVADAQKVQAQLLYWPLVLSYAPVDVRAQVGTRDGCGTSAFQCLDYRFEGTAGTVVLEVLQGPAGCCLDAARPGAVRNVEIRPGVRAQYLVEQPQFGGPILWWVEDTARGPVYVALNSPVFSEDELIRIASSMRPLPAPPASGPSLGPAAPPGVVLDLRIGTGPDQPGVSHTANNPALGPTSVAVDEAGQVYLWDQANGRVLVYDGGRLARKIPVTVPPQARELEVLNSNLYFAFNAPGSRREWELDATTGATLRTIPPPLTGRQSTLYPTTRWTPATPTVNGVWPIGVDRYGNRYERFIDGTCSHGAAVCGEVRRRSATGALLDTAAEPAGITVEDYYVGRNGDVYELRADRGASDVVGVFVIRLLSALPVPHSQVGLDGQVRDYDRMRQDGAQRPGEPPLIPNDGIPPGSALVADALVRLEPYGVETRTDAQGKFVLPEVDVPAPCRWVTVTVTKFGFGGYRLEFALYSPDAHLGLQLWLEHHDVDERTGPPEASANLGEAYCWR